MKNLYISGITGRIGTLLANKVIEDDYFQLIGGITNKDNAHIGKDIGLLLSRDNIGAYIDSEYPDNPLIDIIVDFSSPESTLNLLDKYQAKKLPVLIGTTGFNNSQLATIKKISQELPILFAPNTSAGIAIIKKILSDLGNLFPAESTINISETHHTEKKDSPSGTAIAIKEVISKSFSDAEINIQSYRKGDNPGEHTISFNLDNEIIEITHKALDRSLFVNGALLGARWLSTQPPGLYSMVDIYSS